MADFRINVIVDPSSATVGMAKVDRRLARTERNAQRLQRSLTRAFTLVGVIAAVRELGIMADAVTNAENRLKLVTTSTAQLNEVMGELFNIAKRTRSGFEATATIFSRTALSVKNLGLTQRETLAFTESLNQAIILSGVKAQEANAGLIQLSQGLASGTLRGDELRSVLEQLPKVADVIAVQMRVTRGELRLLGEQGKISAKNVIDAFKNASEELKKAFAETVPTIGQGFQVLRTGLIQFVSEIDDSIKASERLARGMIFLADNLALVGDAAFITGAALAGPLAKVGIGAVIRAIGALTAVIAANPIGALIIGVIAIIAALVRFADRIRLTSDGLVTLQDAAIATFNFIKAAIQPVVDTIVDGFDKAVTFITEAFGTIPLNMNTILSFARTFINNFIGLFVGMGKALKSIFTDVAQIAVDLIGKQLIERITTNVRVLIIMISRGFEAIVDFAKGILKSLGVITSEIGAALSTLEIPDTPLIDTLSKIGANAKNAFLEGFDQDFVGQLEDIVAPALTKITEEARKIAKQRLATTAKAESKLDERGEVSTELPFALREQLRLLKEEQATLKLTSKERKLQNELLKIEQKLRSSNVSLNDPQRELLANAIKLTQALREQAEVLGSIRDPQEAIAQRQATLNQLYRSGAITIAEFNNEMFQLVQAQSDLNMAQGDSTFFDGFISGISSMTDAVRNFAAESGMVFGSFFESLSEGFANSIADAVLFGSSFRDAIRDVARQALSSLLSGLIQVGIQHVLNRTLVQTSTAAQLTGIAAVNTATVAASSTAAVASAAASHTATTAIVTDQAAIAASAAPAAALTSVSSFGSAAFIGLAALAAVLAFSKNSFADGGHVSGAGTSRSDSIPAMLSNGEFVVNAKAASRFRPQLEAMNSGKPAQGGNQNASSQNNQGGSSNQVQPQGGDTKIINVLDPGLVGDFLTSSQGERVLVNVIERNASSISQLLRNN